MMIDHPGQALSSDQLYDVCIAGSGPAGVTLAMQLQQRGLSVLLLEAGGEYFDEKSQAMFDGQLIGDQGFNMGVNRLRYFGGSSNHWGGFCRPLDDADFRNKVSGVDTAWPIARSDLEPYLDQARTILEIACFNPDQPLNDMLTHVHLTYSSVQFANKYRDDLKRAQTLKLCLNACVSNYVERDGRVVAAQVRDPQNNLYTVRARQFVLAAGGIENSRILLWSNVQNEGRLVRDSSALGKYWMEHPHFTIGEAVLTGDPRIDPDRRGRAIIAPSEKAQRERQILNCGLRFETADYEGTKRLIGNLACVAPGLGHWAMKRFGKNLVCGAAIRAAWEQAPVESNQVRLGASRDNLGIPRAQLHWKKSALELRTVRETVLLFSEYLASRNMARVRLRPWVLGNGSFPDDDEQIGNHHMGGTRMSKVPRTGVVDGNCQVHGLANLFVCGSSVFPSAGHANPTLTIVQLALRLATHMSSQSVRGASA
jgi:choline dehydrogenase-like flavoprotein